MKKYHRLATVFLAIASISPLIFYLLVPSHPAVWPLAVLLVVCCVPGIVGLVIAWRQLHNYPRVASVSSPAGGETVREIDHRIRNNLQLVISLLNSQANVQQDLAVRRALDTCQQRVFVLSKAYFYTATAGGKTGIDLSRYLHSLLDFYRQQMRDRLDIDWRVSIDTLLLATDAGISLGLILHEAVSNALQYAFIGRREGVIMVSLHARPDGSVYFSIADNGNGFCAIPDYNANAGLGMQLMTGLAQQWTGRYSIEHDKGVQITIIFAHLQHAVINDALPPQQ